MSSKTEQPTPRRLREERKKGNVARSRIVGGVGALLGGVLLTLAFAGDGWTRLLAWVAELFTHPEAAVAQRWSEALDLFVRLSLPGCVGAVLGAVASSVAVSGPALHFESAAPRLTRVSVSTGWNRIFSLRSLRDLWKTLCMAILLGVTLARGCAGQLRTWTRITEETTPQNALTASNVFAPLQPVLYVLGILGILDLGLTRYRHRRDLMMTRDEVRREYKDSEGDPRHKAQRRALHRQVAAMGPARGVAAATVVVVNPTHFAVALRYDAREAEAPYVVAKGREELAAKIRAEAMALGIPVMRDVPFARSLFQLGLGEELPEELYVAAAAVLKIAWNAREGRLES